MKHYISIFSAIILLGCNSNKKEERPTKEMLEETTKIKVELAYKTDTLLGEGAIWNHESNELYWIDIEGKTLHIYDPNLNTNRSFPTASHIGTVVPKNKNEALIALVDGIHSIDLNTGKTSLFADMKTVLTNCRLNDGKCDPAGRFWVGSMQWQQQKGKANLFTINSDASVTKKMDSVTISNGIVWAKDKKTMYYIDTPTSQIKAYNYDNVTGNISNERVAIQISEDLGFPDGMTIDEEDMVWVGMWNGNAVIRFNPQTGELLQKIEVPAHNVTSCAFGGENLDVLYITTASIDMTDQEKEKYPLAGSVFKVSLGVKGVKSNFFK
ncbi:SMP-30/gluconolactonase/LRE family protein [Winogradskyella flava]|uniref:SMP-30/gluconolactonase/LRE family protein n=1 Tax=Winogradskyella flava TaxID=1884876 RepID=UPI00249171FD|nr:SMP-30/gluconolactonase/LRE family protein [Winogradskyella flava]